MTSMPGPKIPPILVHTMHMYLASGILLSGNYVKVDQPYGKPRNRGLRNGFESLAEYFRQYFPF